MLTAILLPLLAVSTGHTPTKVGLPQAEPALKVWLNRGNGDYVRGDRARVYVKADHDGYVVVLHAEPDGRVRVLFPLDPADDDFVRAGKTYEVRGRGDRDAFTVYDTQGGGLVYAALSRDPFKFEGFVRQDHWDYRVDAFRTGDDAEADLTDLARQMANGSEFEYDLVRYDVSERVAHRSSYYDPYWYGGWYGGWYRPWRSGIYVGISLGAPWYSCWACDPWYYDPWYSPYYYSAWYRPYYYRPYYYGYWGSPWWYRSYYYRPAVVYVGRSYYGYRFGWNRYGVQSGLATQRYGFNYAQPGRRTLNYYDPGRNVIASGRRSVLPPTDIVTPAVAVPRVRDSGPVGATGGRRTVPDAGGPAVAAPRRAGSEARRPAQGVGQQPRRVEPQIQARPARPERQRPSSLREVTPPERRTSPSAPRTVAPTRPQSGERPRLEPRRAPEGRAGPSTARPPAPSPRVSRPEAPRVSRPSAPRVSRPSAPRVSRPSAPRAPSRGGGARAAPSSPRRKG